MNLSKLGLSWAFERLSSLYCYHSLLHLLFLNLLSPHSSSRVLLLPVSLCALAEVEGTGSCRWVALLIFFCFKAVSEGVWESWGFCFCPILCCFCHLGFCCLGPPVKVRAGVDGMAVLLVLGIGDLERLGKAPRFWPHPPLSLDFKSWASRATSVNAVGAVEDGFTAFFVPRSRRKLENSWGFISLFLFFFVLGWICPLLVSESSLEQAQVMDFVSYFNWRILVSRAEPDFLQFLVVFGKARIGHTKGSLNHFLGFCEFLSMSVPPSSLSSAGN